MTDRKQRKVALMAKSGKGLKQRQNTSTTTNNKDIRKNNDIMSFLKTSDLQGVEYLSNTIL